MSILPSPYGVGVENDACAREVTALRARQDGSFRDPARTGKAERLSNDTALPCVNDVSADEVR
jgi:hypothetical protein